MDDLPSGKYKMRRIRERENAVKTWSCSGLLSERQNSAGSSEDLFLTQLSPNSSRDITFVSGRTLLCLADSLGLHPFFLFLWNQDSYCGFCAGWGIQTFSTLAGQNALRGARSERSGKQKTTPAPFPDSAVLSRYKLWLNVLWICPSSLKLTQPHLPPASSEESLQG